MRIVLGLASAVAVLLVVLTCFPSRETRLWRFVDAALEAFVERREEDFLAAFDPAVRYQTLSGTAEIRRDFRRYHGAGLGAPQVLRRTAVLDPEGADVHLEVAVLAGLTPLARASVRMRIVEDEGTWRATSVSWQ